MNDFDPDRENGHAKSIDPLAALEYTEKTGKRAVYEEFTFEPRAGGDVVVTNDSHGDDGEEHTYTVHVTSGIPSDCTCPADEYHEGACKHRVAVALRPALCDVVDVGADQPVATDGGSAEWTERADALDDTDGEDVVDLSERYGEAPPESDDGDECEECAELADGWPCAQCYVAGDAEFETEVL
jgi:hypothetical protein